MIGTTGDRLKRLDPIATPIAGTVARVVHPRRRSIDERVLIVRPGGMGDLVMAQLAAERTGLALDSTVWLIDGRSAGWARNQGLSTVVYDDSLVGAVRAVLSRHNTVINTEQLFGLSMAVARLATARGGTLSAFATNRAAGQADRVVPYDWDAAPETDQFGTLFASATGRPSPEPIASSRPTRRRPAGSHVVLALGGTHAPSRAIAAGDWVHWVRAVVGDRKVEVTAGPMEEDLATAVLDRLGGQGVRFRGSFDDVIDRISTAERILAVDGGPVHIASYYGVPADVIFTAGRHGKWVPLAAGSRVHRRDDLPCQPCTVFGQVPPCPIEFQCRKGIPGVLKVFPVDQMVP